MTYRALQIIVTVPVLLDLCSVILARGCRAKNPGPSPTSSSGIRDSSRAPDTRAGMTEKFDRADVRVTILCRTSGTQRLPGLRRQKERCGKWRNAKRRKGLSTLISDLATKKTLQSIRACSKTA